MHRYNANALVFREREILAEIFIPERVFHLSCTILIASLSSALFQRAVLRDIT